MYSFEYPLVFLLAPLPLLVALIPFPQKTPIIIARFVGEYAHIITSSKKNKLRLVLLWFIWLNLLIASANPIKSTSIPTTSSDKNIMFVLDISYSMENHYPLMLKSLSDIFATTTLTAGLVAFGYKAYLISPLTPFTYTLIEFLNRLDIGQADENELSGSSINDALFLAINELSSIKEPKEKSIVLITDGEDTNSRLSSEYIASLSKEKNISIHKIILTDTETNNDIQVKSLLGLSPSSAITHISLAKIPLWLSFITFLVLVMRFGRI